VGPPETGGPTPPVCGDIVVDPGAGPAGREVCLSVGSTLRIRLDTGQPDPVERGVALHELSRGVYSGARAGTAEVSGFRRVCPSAAPGHVGCHSITGWKVTVDVR
jgi:hypothetical protein